MTALPAPEMPDLARLPPARLRAMQAAGREVEECTRVLAKAGGNLVAEVLRGQGPFYEWDHYPAGDVFDHETHAHYYYHAHRGNDAEHGHFHTFLHRRGMPEGVRPLVAGEGSLSHLVAVAMDAYGEPIRLFCTNRWVTGESWYRAADVVAMLDRFVIDHAYPSWPLNRWLGALLRLYQPQIAALVRQRDQVISAWGAARPGRDVYEDPELEVTGALDIRIAAQISAVQSALARADLTND